MKFCISVIIGWMAMKFGVDIEVSLRLNVITSLIL